ncbi:hypothetical protein ACI7YQ_15085 [Alteromonas marina]|uniref:hypothetical protein n=1 Tax=Alteromonas sp. OM2203 TaxID=3398817 RepID=UPI003AF39870
MTINLRSALYTNPHRKVPTQKALASFLAKRGNAGMAAPFQIPRMKLGSLPDLPEGRV